MKRFTTQTAAQAMLTPVDRVRIRARTSDRVYDELASAIRELRLAPGAALSETDLSEQLHVSRTPLREAIARLVENGLVSVVPQVGTRVELIDLDAVELAQFIRESLEVAAFARAARGEPDVSGLREILAAQKRAHKANDSEAFFAADEAFHEEIFALSGHRGAWSAMQTPKFQLDRLTRLRLPDRATVAELIKEHTAIVAALGAGDARVGKPLVTKHVRRVLEYGPALRAQRPELFTP